MSSRHATEWKDKVASLTMRKACSTVLYGKDMIDLPDPTEISEFPSPWFGGRLERNKTYDAARLHQSKIESGVAFNCKSFVEECVKLGYVTNRLRFVSVKEAEVGVVGKDIYGNEIRISTFIDVNPRIFDILINGNAWISTVFDVKTPIRKHYVKWDITKNKTKRTVLLHREIMKDKLESGNDNVIDHIDRNPLNNRCSNLRVVSQSVNAKNMSHTSYKKNATNSGFRGVTKNREAFIARVIRMKEVVGEDGIIVKKQDTYTRHFSIKLYGEEEALRRAIKARKEVAGAYSEGKTKEEATHMTPERTRRYCGGLTP